MSRSEPIGDTMVSSEELRRRPWPELGEEVSAGLPGRDLFMVGVLKGAVLFLADLMRGITVPCEVRLHGGRPAGSADRPSGVVRILKDLDTSIEGRHVLIVEDIIDSGLTLQYLMRTLNARNPASLEVCALLTKPERLRVDLSPRYIGFEITEPLRRRLRARPRPADTATSTTWPRSRVSGMEPMAALDEG